MSSFKRFRLENTSKNREFLTKNFGSGVYFVCDFFIEVMVLNTLCIWQTYSLRYLYDNKLDDVNDIDKYVRKLKLKKLNESR